MTFMIRFLVYFMLVFSIIITSVSCGSKGDDATKPQDATKDAGAAPDKEGATGSASKDHFITGNEFAEKVGEEYGVMFKPREVPDKRIPDSYDGMTKVPGGTYYYQFTSEEEIAKEVTVWPYYMDEQEVSVAKFKAFVDATNYVTTAEKKGFAYVIHGDRITTTDGASWKQPEGPGSSIADIMEHPVTFITYIDARSYCEHYNKRLPTKVEMEFAAGGEEQKNWANGFNFTPDDYNFIDNSGGKTKSANWGPKNTFGLYNMSGNVWEWAADKFRDPFPNDFLESSPKTFALCGGSYNSSKDALRVRIRIFHNPAKPYNDIGFRCAADPKE